MAMIVDFKVLTEEFVLGNADVASKIEIETKWIVSMAGIKKVIIGSGVHFTL